MIIDHRETVVAQMPNDVSAVLFEIEKFSGVRVSFRDTTLLKLAGGKNTDVEAVYVDHEKAYLSLPDPTKIDANAVLHELLHLHRYWVQMVPQIEPKKDIGINVEIAADIDNNLEHLVIVPKEREYGFNPEPYWTALTETYWQSFPWAYLPAEAQRRFYLMGWLNASLAAPEARDRVAERLNGYRMFAEAERFLKRVSDLLYSKPRATAAVVRFLNIPKDEIRLVVLDIRNRRQIYQELPAN